MLIVFDVQGVGSAGHVPWTESESAKHFPRLFCFRSYSWQVPELSVHFFFCVDGYFLPPALRYSPRLWNRNPSCGACGVFSLNGCMCAGTPPAGLPALPYALEKKLPDLAQTHRIQRFNQLGHGCQQHSRASVAGFVRVPPQATTPPRTLGKLCRPCRIH